MSTVATPTPRLRAPFPYFGGKSRAAGMIWARLGDPDNLIVPFFGSGAELWARPPWSGTRIETVNDVDCMVANFWRATKRGSQGGDDGEGLARHMVAEYADWPVNEVDLHARHRHLVLSAEAAEFRARMRTDPEYYDVKLAGWWCWGICCWIGGGWCTAHGGTADGGLKQCRPEMGGDGQYGRGVCRIGLDRTRPDLSGEPMGRGVHACPWGTGADVKERLPKLAGGAFGYGGSHMHADLPKETNPQRRPKLSGGAEGSCSLGTGVHANGLPHLSQQVPGMIGGRDDRGVNGLPQVPIESADGTGEQRRAWLTGWFGRLRDRLRNVRVCCGDWLRVCDSESVTVRLGTTGLILDPPYPTQKECGAASRDGHLYASDFVRGGGDKTPEQLRDGVLAYCTERGADARMRIAVCGYDSDGYAALESLGWERVAWKAQGGYGNRSDAGQVNRGRERIWFSPGCVHAAGLFGGTGP